MEVQIIPGESKPIYQSVSKCKSKQRGKLSIKLNLSTNSGWKICIHNQMSVLSHNINQRSISNNRQCITVNCVALMHLVNWIFVLHQMSMFPTYFYIQISHITTYYEYINSSMTYALIFVAGCYMLEDGHDYQGEANQTYNGHPCQKWSSQSPNSHDYHDASLFIDNTLEEIGSYCRNPQKTSSSEYEQWPWCYTLRPSVRWALCYIGDSPYCGKHSNDFSLC